MKIHLHVHCHVVDSDNKGVDVNPEKIAEQLEEFLERHHIHIKIPAFEDDEESTGRLVGIEVSEDNDSHRDI